MISISTDNSEIFQLLEKCDCVFNLFSVDRTNIFDYEDNCYVVLYSANTRNFILFKAESFNQNSDVLPSLLNALQEFSSNDYSNNLIKQAIRLVENKMYSKNNNRFYYDAH